jgi:dipeptidyl-peptidase-3
MKAFLNFAAQFLGNCGNYKSFGDSKFIPAASFGSQELEKLSGVSEKAKSLHGRIGKRLFFTEGNPGHMHLGFPDAGHVSSYYPDSPSITKEEIQLVGDFLETKKLLAENTRLRSTSSGDYEVLIASAITAAPSGGSDAGPTTEWTLTGKLEGKKLRLVFGDYSEEMTKITTSIRKTRENAANEVERQMHEAYARHFETGSMQAFKDSQRFWIRDKGPMVECNIGFIETYRDPHGVRGEWEGFVAMVNQERTEAFGKLVASAESMISKLPWPKDFEKDKFLSPDFTSLEVLSFQGSGIPAGINIP